MTTVSVGNVGIELTALPPFFLQSCNLVDPVAPTDPGSGQPTLPPADLWVPIAPTIPEASIPTVTAIVDDSPARIVGCIYDTSSDPQGRLNALFPDAIAEDGVIERLTNDIWVLRDGSWQNVGPTPGPRVVTTVVIPASNETVVLQGVTGPGLEVLSLPYSLDATTEVSPISVRVGILAVGAIDAPAAEIGIQAQEPSVASGASSFVPSAGITLGAQGPGVSTGARADIPPVGLQFITHPPAGVGKVLKLDTAFASLLASAIAPAVSGGGSVLIPVAGIDISSIAPTIGGIPPLQGFTGDYATENWTFEGGVGDGSVDTSNAPSSITITGSNTDTGDTIDDLGTPINTDYTITALQSGIISFNWDYSSEDEEDFDGFGYLLNGLFTLIADNATQGTGFTQFNVNQNDVFGFRVFTVDDVLGAGVAVISDFLF